MPEPLSIATAAIGTSIGLLGLLASTLSGLNGRKRSIVDFGPRLRVLIMTLERCQGDLTEWDTMWNWKAYSDDVYRKLWAGKFETINRQRTDVSVNAEDLSKYVKDFLNIREDQPGESWRDSISGRGRFRLLVTKFRFAVFSEQTLREKVDLLDKDIKNLKDLCDKRMRVLKGETPAPKTTEEATGRFVSLGEFGQKVWALRRQELLAACSAWTLELWPSGHSRSARLSDWQTMTEVQISIAFQCNTPVGESRIQDQSVMLKYALEKQPEPDNWADGLANRVQDEQNAERNPTVHREDAAHKKTATFRDLFGRQRFFANPRVHKAWENDLGHLLLSLAQWSALLWDTNWTTNLCSSGIRYVRRLGEKSFLHTLSPRQDHDPTSSHQETRRSTAQRNISLGDPGAQEREQQSTRREADTRLLNETLGAVNQQDGENGNLGECCHGGQKLKLKNLGLVMAEFICTTLFRFQETDTSKYERWDHENATWIETTGDCILDDVEAKSRSRGIREAVGFCLRSRESSPVPDGLGTFLHHYEEEVMKPLKDWSTVIHGPFNRELLDGVLSNGLVWPHGAFEGGDDTRDDSGNVAEGIGGNGDRSVDGNFIIGGNSGRVERESRGQEMASREAGHGLEDIPRLELPLTPVLEIPGAWPSSPSR